MHYSHLAVSFVSDYLHACLKLWRFSRRLHKEHLRAEMVPTGHQAKLTRNAPRVIDYPWGVVDATLRFLYDGEITRNSIHGKNRRIASLVIVRRFQLLVILKIVQFLRILL